VPTTVAAIPMIILGVNTSIWRLIRNEKMTVNKAPVEAIGATKLAGL
jgi:hypothetical protein